MIFLRILSKTEAQIEATAKLLLQQRLVLDVNLKRHIDRIELVDDVLVTLRVYLLTAKTKASLFPAIDKLLLDNFAADMPEVYSLPIVHMDWEQAQQLSTEVRDA